MAARQKQGLHIVSLAAQLKVSPARLEALEAERWSALPDATHARALATSVCRLLRIDPKPVLDGMPRGPGAGLERVSAGLNQPVRQAGPLRGLAPGMRWTLFAVAMLLMAAVALLVWPRPDALPAAAPEPALEMAPVVAPTLTPAPGAEAASAVPLAASAAERVESLPPSAAALTSQAAPAQPVPIQPVAALPVNAAGAVLEIRAERGASWVSVVDASGSTLASRLLQSGEALSLEPKSPVRVTLGNAPALALRWRGQSQALEGYETVRVAKLELK